MAVSDRLIPSSSDQVLRLIRPASFQVARHETRELSLAFIYGVAAVVALVVMVIMSAAGHAISPQAGDIGFVIGLILTWFAFAGLVVHCARYLVARATKNYIERAYRKRVGRSSSKDAALGHQVIEGKPRLLLALTHSTDWDFAIQAVIALALTTVTH